MSRRNVKLRLVLLDSRQVNHTAAVGLAEGTSDRVKVEDVLCCFQGVKLVRAWVLDHDDDDDDEFPTFLGASGLSAVTFPTDTVYRLRGESGAHENPPPKEATTLQTLPSKWRAAGALEDTFHCTWENQSAGECGQQYIAYMDQHRGDLQRLGRRLQMQVCRNEPDEEGSYKCLAKNYLAIADYFRGQANAQARNLVLGYAVYKTAVTQGKETRSDVLLYATSEEGEVGSRLLDKVLFTVAEMKTVNCSPDALQEGLGQILQKANIAMRARSVRYHQLAGSVHTGEKLQSVLVTAHAGSQANTAVCTRMLQLVSDSSSSSHMRRIDCDSQGWWEMVWHVYHGLYSQLQHLRLAAQAQILDESLPPDVEVLVQLGGCPDSRVRGQRSVLVCRLLSTNSGVFTGTVQTGSGSMQEVFVKIGHPPACQALAIHLGQPWEPWYQVERELAVRCGLQTPPRNLAPLVAGGPVVGVLSSSDDCSSNNSSSSARASSNSSNNNSLTDTRDNCYPGLVGRSVLVLSRTGIPLVQGAVLPVLALHEAMQLLICLLMLVLDLLDNGVYWNDLRPNNIGINPSAPPSHRYYGFDLGAASSKAVDVWACKTVYPGEQRKLLPSQYSPVSDLEYGSLEAIQGEELNNSCDLQSAVYTTYLLAGNVLPWKAAADAGDVQAVIKARLSAAADPAMMPGLTAWPQDVQQLAHAAMRGEQHAATIARQIAANQ